MSVAQFWYVQKKRMPTKFGINRNRGYHLPIVLRHREISMNALSRQEVTGLVLTGGGVRGAYQAGALKAVAEFSGSETVPFPVIAGVSVGALNGFGLASNASDFQASVATIEKFWKSLRSDRVFRNSNNRIIMAGLRLAASYTFPRFFGNAPRSLLDISPLKTALEEAVDVKGISNGIASGILKSVGVTCSGYSSGHAITFFEGDEKISEWSRMRRDGRRTILTLEHVMASASLPLLFPAILLGEEYFGDGLLRLTSPLAPAIHMGATKLMIIGTRDLVRPEPNRVGTKPHYPTPGDFGGYALDTVFHDSLDADVERLRRVNYFLERLTPSQKESVPLKHIDALLLRPSRSLHELALEHMDKMPPVLSRFLKDHQSKSAPGSIESHLMFEPDYIKALFNLGYNDTISRRQELEAFFANEVGNTGISKQLTQGR